MGLAPYGQPRFVEEMRRIVRLGSDGGYELDLTFLSPPQGENRVRMERRIARVRRSLYASA